MSRMYTKLASGAIKLDNHADPLSAVPEDGNCAFSSDSEGGPGVPSTQVQAIKRSASKHFADEFPEDSGSPKASDDDVLSNSDDENRSDNEISSLTRHSASASLSSVSRQNSCADFVNEAF